MKVPKLDRLRALGAKYGTNKKVTFVLVELVIFIFGLEHAAGNGKGALVALAFAKVFFDSPTYWQIVYTNILSLNAFIGVWYLLSPWVDGDSPKTRWEVRQPGTRKQQQAVSEKGQKK